jgi:hypothetical protein
VAAARRLPVAGSRVAADQIEAQPLRHANQVSERFRSHFLHHARALSLNRLFGSAKFGPDLFVEEAVGDQDKNFAFTRGQRRKAVLQDAQLANRGSRLTAQFDRARNGL